MKNLTILQTTVSKVDDARSLASILLEKKLIGCAQIDGPIESIYRWKDKIEQDEEFRLTVKTTTALADKTMSTIEEHHPYEVPEIIGSTMEIVAEKYGQWLEDEVDGE